MGTLLIILQDVVLMAKHCYFMLTTFVTSEVSMGVFSSDDVESLSKHVWNYKENHNTFYTGTY